MLPDSILHVFNTVRKDHFSTQACTLDRCRLDAWTECAGESRCVGRFSALLLHVARPVHLPEYSVVICSSILTVGRLLFHTCDHNLMQTTIATILPTTLHLAGHHLWPGLIKGLVLIAQKDADHICPRKDTSDCVHFMHHSVTNHR